MNVVYSKNLPKRRVPITPKTDDMRDMMESLVARGAARPQFRLVEQSFIINGQLFAPKGVHCILSNVVP